MPGALPSDATAQSEKKRPKLLSCVYQKLFSRAHASNKRQKEAGTKKVWFLYRRVFSIRGMKSPALRRKAAPGVHGLPAFLILCCMALAHAEAPPPKGIPPLRSAPEMSLKFAGVVGERITANTQHWLKPAPAANPGMLGMFRVRDRLPAPALVPWAGEFAGKYLISCVQALRLGEDEALRAQVAAFVAELLATQAEDGYLGPFTRSRRLLGEWDLWGHYHVMQGLLLWHDEADDPAALAAVRRAADLICRTYLEGGKRVIDAGSPEMNMAVAHVLADLHRRTGEPRYLAMAREIEKDWERAGDYLRTGEKGVPFYQTPLPRWESLHDVQALAALWQITGEARYRDAFASHWRTIREFDVRNSGAFSGGEQATGNAFAPTAIETCCTVAWMALSVDMLRLTGDPRVADELELSTFNGGLGAQHPSGRWWTYNTPMDGERKASAHDIVFQARAGTPELNCCSVNGPRVLGMLADWAVMRQADGAWVVNWHGPWQAAARDGALALRCETDYPATGRVVWRLRSETPQLVRFRIPGWAAAATARLAGQPLEIQPSAYAEIERIWREDEPLEFEFPMTLRAAAGQREQAGKASVYRGPLLLAYDQSDNAFDEINLPRLDPATLGQAQTVPVAEGGVAAPWVLVDLPAAGGKTLRLRDFASAGAAGTRYRSWLWVAGEAARQQPSAEKLALRADLRGDAHPQTGRLAAPPRHEDFADALRLNGKGQMAVYEAPENWAAGDYTIAVRVRINALPPGNQLGHVFSAWCAGGDDPARLVASQGLLFARIEASPHGASTGGVPITVGEWQHLAVVKAGGRLTLFLNGEPAAHADAPSTAGSASRRLALGGNPLYTGAPEFLAADFSHFRLYTRALSDAEVAGLAE